MKGALVFLGIFVLVLAATLGEPSIPLEEMYTMR
jgi:hypothetical protein